MSRRKRAREPVAPPEVSGPRRESARPTGMYVVLGILLVLLAVATVLVVTNTHASRTLPPRAPGRPMLPTPAGPDTIDDAPTLEVPRDTTKSGAPLLPAPMDEGGR